MTPRKFRSKAIPLPRAADLMTERQLRDGIATLARTLGWLVYFTHDSRRSPPGYPDLTLVRDGRIVFAELKTMKGRLRPEQREWLNELDRTGAEVCLWRPSDWLDGAVDAVLGRRKAA